jgi:hypothetical protein
MTGLLWVPLIEDFWRLAIHVVETFNLRINGGI